MKKIERITRNIQENSELNKSINTDKYASIDTFMQNATRYIKAIKEGRMLCVIERVSASGMSRNIKFMECSGKAGNFRYYNFYQFFRLLGYTRVNNSDSFRIGGCGMDMIFHTNYTIIHRLTRLGFLTKKECEHLCQQTPTVI